MKYYLSHHTTLDGLEGILKSKALLSPEKSGSSLNHGDTGEDDDSIYMKKYKTNIFTSLMIPVQKIIPEYPYKDEYTWEDIYYPGIFLIFDAEKILKDKKLKTHWCGNWNYGFFEKDECYYYDESLSYKENLEIWIEFRREIFENYLKNKALMINNGVPNELVIKDKLPLKYLKYIYIHIPKKDNEDDIIFEWFDSQVSKIEQLKNQYPQYEWRIELPEIPFCSYRF